MLSGYLKNRLPPSDRVLLQKWYDSFGEAEEGVPGLEDQSASEKLGEELDRRIRSIAEQPAPKRLVPWRKMAAAIVLLAVAGAALWYAGDVRIQQPTEKPSSLQLVFHEVKTGVRQVKKLTLPGGSSIHLNANSKIRIPEVFDNNSRTVYLDEGEAFFEVARDSLRPFLVESGALHIKVLGTAFNVRAYHGLDDIAVAVSAGRVQVSDTSGVLGELTANQGISYSKENGVASIYGVSAGHVHAWMTGVVHLEKAGFEELALAMANLYGIALKSEDPQTAGYRYNLIVRSDRSLEETMDLICQIHKNNYRRKENEITIYP